MTTSNKPFNAEAWIAGLRAQTEAGNVPLDKRVSQNWSKLNSEGKANVAIWGAGALFSAFNTVGAGRNSFSRDADGNVHTQWSNVGIALFSAVLTFGCAYAAVHTLHSAGR